MFEFCLGEIVRHKLTNERFLVRSRTKGFDGINQYHVAINGYMYRDYLEHELKKYKRGWF